MEAKHRIPRTLPTITPHECVIVHLAATGTARVNAAGPAHPARRVLIRGEYRLETRDDLKERRPLRK